MKLLYVAFIILTIGVVNSAIEKTKLRHHVINRVKKLSEQIEEDNTVNGDEANKAGANETARTINDDNNTNNWITTVKSNESLRQVQNNIDERAVSSNEIYKNPNKSKDPSKNKIAAREDFVGTMCFDNKERADDGSCVSVEPTASSKEIEEFYKEMKKTNENSALKLEV